MKIGNLLYAMAIACSMAACSKEETPILPPDKTEQEQNKPDNNQQEEEENNPSFNQKLALKLNPTLTNIIEARKGVITQWQQNNKIGLYTNKTNLEYTFNGEAWIPTKPYEVKKEQTIYAYHPYTEDKNFDPVGNPLVTFDIEKQDDILYGQCNVNPDFTTATPEMKHALSLIRIIILRDEYIGKGLVTDMQVNNVPKFIEMDYTNGVSGPIRNSQRINIPIGGGFYLNQQNPTVTEAIMPTRGTEYDITLSFYLDGKKMTYNFPKRHEWKPGMMYTYSIYIKGQYNAEINKEDVPIDIEHWSQFGKTDNITIKEIGFTDFENMFSIATNHTQFGYDCYQYEGKPFGLFYYHSGNKPFEGKVRFVFMKPNTNQIIEKFQPIDIKVDGWDGKKIQCYVTANPGTYQLVPLFQRKGESQWFKAVSYENQGTDQDWMYEVKQQAPENLPALRNILLEKEGDNSNFFSYNIPFNKPFNVVYTISNKSKKTLKGEIKAVWEREFKLKANSYRPGTKREDATNDNQWCDTIGQTFVNIPQGVKFWKGIVPCKVTKYYPMPERNGHEYAGPILHLYWGEEGTKQWKLMRLDADFLFNTNYNGKDIWDETLNYINVSLEDWYA